jgi:hypothetical protein
VYYLVTMKLLGVVAGLILLAIVGSEPAAQSVIANIQGDRGERKKSKTNGAEQAVKAFLLALYSNDFVAYQKTIVPEPDSNDLLGKAPITPEELKSLRQEVDSISLTQSSPFVADGNELDPRKASQFPLGTRTTFVTGFHGSLLAIPVVLTQSGWKADVRFWLAARREALGKEQEPEPEAKARAFLFFILARKPEKLAALSASSIKGEEYTAANDLPGGDLDQVLSLCLEMPIIRAKSGEGYRLPSGEIIRADGSADAMVLVGMMGSIEVPFHLKRVAGEWKVVPQRYFEMLRRIGAI